MEAIVVTGLSSGFFGISVRIKCCPRVRWPSTADAPEDIRGGTAIWNTPSAAGGRSGSLEVIEELPASYLRWVTYEKETSLIPKRRQVREAAAGKVSIDFFFLIFFHFGDGARESGAHRSADA